MDWTTLNYSNSAVDKAGDILRIEPTAYNGTPEAFHERFDNAYKVLSNFRAAHAFALNAMQILLRRMSKSVDSGALIAQRLKRVESIFRKLQRFQDMSLARMQDIGGCRA